MQADVLHVVPAYYPTRGGIEVLVENLTVALNSRGELHHGVLAPRVDGERPDDFTYGDAPVWSVDAPHPNSLRVPRTSVQMVHAEHVEFARILLATRRAIDTTKPRLIHIHGMSLVASATSAIATERGIPVVMHVHGSVDGGLSLRMKRQILTAPRVLAVSGFVARSIERETGRSEGITVIPNGLPDPGEISPLSDSNGSAHVVTLVGRLEHTKGFDLALRALARVKPRVPRLTIRVIGVGQELEALERLATDMDLTDEVTFLGRLDREAVLANIRESTCVMVPSRALEGFSLVALESALLARPVVAASVGGLPETVIDGVTGTVVHPRAIQQTADAVIRYLTDSELTRVHGTNARDRALRNFSLDRMVSEIQTVYEQILTSGSTR